MTVSAVQATGPVTGLPGMGSASLHLRRGAVGCDHVTLGGKPYVCIRRVDAMAPFFMSVVSSNDLWLYVGSNGAFTAGRIDPDHAMFPYETVDHILRDPGFAGVSTTLLITREGTPQVSEPPVWEPQVWEPWCESGRLYDIQRNLYKHDLGTEVIFEEENRDLELTFRWSLSTCDRYGLVRRSSLVNTGTTPVHVRTLDGWHRIVPAGVDCRTYREMSYLAEAYMRHERIPGLPTALFTLNAGISDRPEAAESLRATVAWSLGHERPVVLLSDHQRTGFLQGNEPAGEDELRGETGVYAVAEDLALEPGAGAERVFVIDTGLDHADVVALREELRSPARLTSCLEASLEQDTAELRRRMAAADALQHSGEPLTHIHHFANVLFNCMRGGVLPASASFPRGDFIAFVGQRNPQLGERHRDVLRALPETCTLEELDRTIRTAGDIHLERLAGEYLPLTFSRRHGDPSRPWNWFSIRLRDEAGRPVCSYEGNWRDIFQNWEALGQSFPGFLERMIHVFLNASTADGYNPYRITRAGIDWEVEEPGNTWANIGYWGDHQLIYLLRLLESFERFHPGRLANALAEERCAYARVPYRIAPFDQLCRDPRHTLTFLADLDQELKREADVLGNDAKLVRDADGDVLLVSLAEKLLAPLLVKLSNFVPEGGIWLNTQRPEWNDANNALAGWGLSMVTVYHMRRYLVFCRALFSAGPDAPLSLTPAVAVLLETLSDLFEEHAGAAGNGLDDQARYRFLERAGKAGEAHRVAVYEGAFGPRRKVDGPDVLRLLDAALAVVDATIAANRTDAGLYHSYNTLDLSAPGAAAVHPLFPMLEGQVAVLGAGFLSPAASVELLDVLRRSDLYREDQHTYILYPDRALPAFTARNDLPVERVADIGLLARMLAQDDARVVRRDVLGGIHFHGDLRNALDLNLVLDRLAADEAWRDAAAADREAVLALWEDIFSHREFTGRSGTFFAFEGLGSVYWHMVAKLLLAVQESHQRALDLEDRDAAEKLAAAYMEVREGLGFRKTPEAFGAFPTDPYSHTPAHRGAQQPGMTGQVKEEILTRWGELGVTVSDGRVAFDPRLLSRSEFTDEPGMFPYVNLEGQEVGVAFPARSLCFTLAQVPVRYVLGDKPSVTLAYDDGSSETFPGGLLPRKQSEVLFARDASIRCVTARIDRRQLRA